MPLIEILIVGTNQPIMGTIERLINKEGIWKATIALSTEEAMRLAKSNLFNIVLLCAGIPEELDLKEKLAAIYPKLPIVKHYGGGSGLLFAEIHQALTTNQH